MASFAPVRLTCAAAALALTLPIVPDPAGAATRKIERYTVSGWKGLTAVDTETGQFKHCRITRSATGSRSFTLSLMADGAMAAIGIDTAWRLGSNKVSLAGVTAGGRDLGGNLAYIRGGNSVIIFFREQSQRALEAYTRGGSTVIEVKGQSLRFRLPGARSAMSRLKKCFRKHAAAGSAHLNSGRSGGSGNSASVASDQTRGRTNTAAREVAPDRGRPNKALRKLVLALAAYKKHLVGELGRAGVHQPRDTEVRLVSLSPSVVTWPGGQDVRGFLAQGRLPSAIDPKLGMETILKSIATPCSGPVAMKSVNSSKTGAWQILDGEASCRVGTRDHTFAVSGYFKGNAVNALGFVGTTNAAAATARTSNRKMRAFLVKTLDPGSSSHISRFETRKQ